MNWDIVDGFLVGAIGSAIGYWFGYRAAMREWRAATMRQARQAKRGPQ